MFILIRTKYFILYQRLSVHHDMYTSVHSVHNNKTIFTRKPVLYVLSDNNASVRIYNILSCVRPHCFIFWITLPENLKKLDFQKKQNNKTTTTTTNRGFRDSLVKKRFSNVH